ncbi:olfactory receptor 6C74-like [Discoglossus pictus]
MKPTNQTMPAFFIITGISDVPEFQAPIFLLVLLIYLISLGGNMTILVLVCLDHHLHTPMYFFLGNLSFLDMSSTTVTLHKVLITFISGDKTVSFIGCMTQMYFFASLTSQELLLLTAMSYDRYVAICHPLRYHVFMRTRVCVSLTIFCWVFGFLQILPPVIILSGYSCYISNEVNHFFCDMVPVMRLSCSDTSILKLLTLTEGLILATLLPFLLTFISYVFIIITILKICSSAERRKAFLSCSAHLTVVILLYVILVCQYMTPSLTTTAEYSKLFSLFNTAAVPVLNPLIYSLKNKDVKAALRKRLRLCQVIR